MLFGRDAERALIGALLDAARDSRSGALALRGEAGVGKTVLLEDARARAGDMHVLPRAGSSRSPSCRSPRCSSCCARRCAISTACPRRRPPRCGPRSGSRTAAAQERFLIYSGLPVAAVRARRGAAGAVPRRRRPLARRGSSDALQFVARRLDAEGVVLLFSAREGDVRVFEAPDVPSHTVDGLDDVAAPSCSRTRPPRPRRRSASACSSRRTATRWRCRAARRRSAPRSWRATSRCPRRCR